MFTRQSLSTARHARSGLATLASLILLIPIVSTAQDAICRLNGDQSITMIGQHLDRLSELLPPISPDQAKAMADRQRLGLELGLDGRDPSGASKAVDDLKSNPHYYLWRLRDALKRARASVGIILMDAASLHADKYIGVGLPRRFYAEELADVDATRLDHAGFAVGPVAALEVEIGEYLLSERQRAHSDLTPKQRIDIEALASGYTAELGRYMQCKLRDVVARQNATPLAPKSK